jgi:hypothetical protein
MNFVSKKVVEIIIKKELKNALNSNFNVNLQIFSIQSLKNGEFKNLVLKSKNVNYETISISNFYAETLNDYNKILYQDKKVYYPSELPFKFSGEITNKDIENILSSEEFKEEIETRPVKINGISLFTIKNLEVEIKNDKIHVKMPITTLFGDVNLKFSANIEVENNKIVLKTITFHSKSNIMNEKMLINLINKINPFDFEKSALNGKYCKFLISKATIVNDKIEVDGLFIINKNLADTNE